MLTVALPRRLRARAVGTGDRGLPRTAAIVLALPRRLPARLPRSASSTSRRSRRSSSGGRDGQVRAPLPVPRRRASPTSPGARERFYWRSLGWFVRRASPRTRLRRPPARSRRAAAANLDQPVLSPLTGGASSINVYGAIEGDERLPAERAHRRPEPPRRSCCSSRCSSSRRSTCGSSAATGCACRSPSCSRSCSSSSSRRSRAAGCSGSSSALLVLAVPVPAPALLARAPRAARASRSSSLVEFVARGRSFFELVLRSRVADRRRLDARALPRLRLRPAVLHSHPLFGLGLNNFSVYYEFVTGKTNWGPHSFYVALIVETGLVGAVAVPRLPPLPLLRGCAPRSASGRRLRAPATPRRARVAPLAWGLTAALAGTMAANFFYLTMQFYYFYAFAHARARVPIVFGRRLRRT